MKEIWQRIENWLETNAPEILNSLQTGASEQELQELESVILVRLPDDVRESFSIHNGQSEAQQLIDSRYFLTLQKIKDDWLQWKEMFESGDYGANDESAGKSPIEIKSGWYNSKWIPLSNDAASNQNFLDLAPTEHGTVGQIILYLHDDSEITELVAKSYRSWLEKFASDLESGEYTLEDGDLVRTDELFWDEDDDS